MFSHFRFIAYDLLIQIAQFKCLFLKIKQKFHFEIKIDLNCNLDVSKLLYNFKNNLDGFG